MKPYKNEPPAVFFDLDIETLSCAIQERAAILEYDAGMTREEAENTAARAYGYKDWEEYEIATLPAGSRGHHHVMGAALD